MARSGSDLPERMQLCRPRWPKETVPRVGTKPHDTGKAPFQVTKFHRSQQRAEVSAERAQGCAIVKARLECRDEEDRGAAKRRGYRLRKGTQATYLEFTASSALLTLCVSSHSRDHASSRLIWEDCDKSESCSSSVNLIAVENNEYQSAVISRLRCAILRCPFFHRKI
jgi:hypothetical protein